MITKKYPLSPLVTKQQTTMNNKNKSIILVIGTANDVKYQCIKLQVHKQAVGLHVGFDKCNYEFFLLVVDTLLAAYSPAPALDAAAELTSAVSSPASAPLSFVQFLSHLNFSEANENMLACPKSFA